MIMKDRENRCIYKQLITTKVICNNYKVCYLIKNKYRKLIQSNNFHTYFTYRKDIAFATIKDILQIISIQLTLILFFSL